jgi:hypothetical protein
MSRSSCPREADVLRAAARGWRGDADVRLTEHVAACARCTEVRAAADLLRAQHVRDMQGAPVPSSAAMWYRLERRLRDEHARRLQRIAFATQAIVLAATAGGAGAVLQIASPWLPGVRGVAADTWHALTVLLGGVAQLTTAWTLPIAIVAVAWLLLLPAALFLGLADE